MTDTNVPLLGQNREQDTPVITEAVTALLVYLTPEGVVMFTPDINLPVTIQRQATGNDMLSMVTATRDEIIMTTIAQQSAQATISAQMQLGAQIAEAQRNQQILQQANMGGLAR